MRIGSFWNDAAADTLVDFGYSCLKADSVPKFSGNNYYEGAWDVGQHLVETNAQNGIGLDALVQFTMNDRNNFIHGMLSSTASQKAHLKHSEIKRFAMQWLGVAYEYARTGKVTATNDVTQEQAELIFKGFIDTYGQLDENAHDMCVSLKVGSKEASIKVPHRRMRLRALGMMCHTMEDFWCPAHTCRTYNPSGSIKQYSILAFCNYKQQNGDKKPMFGYHIPFDRYALSDRDNSPNWREALTRGYGDEYVGTETLERVLDSSMGKLDGRPDYFNTLGMNETIACITQLFEYFYQGTKWDDGVRQWVDSAILPTYFDGEGQSYVCDAGRRCLHTPTYLIAPITSLQRAYKKTGLTDYDKVLAAVKSFDAWQRGAHAFYSGSYNTTKSKLIDVGLEGNNIWSDKEGEQRLIVLVGLLHNGYSTAKADGKDKELLDLIGCNGCHDMVSALSSIGGMLQEFNIDLRGSLRSDEVMENLKEVRAFYESGLQGKGKKAATQSLTTHGLLAPEVAYADEGDEKFVTANMAIEDYASLEDGSYLIAVRDMDSLETSIMVAPKNTPGIDKLEEDLANLTITYSLETEFDDDIDYSYIVSEIDYTDMEKSILLATGTVKSVSKTSIVIDLLDIENLTLAIKDGTTDIPKQGDYICVRYTFGKSGLVFVDYDLLDAPESIKTVKYPVAKVAGSRAWLLPVEKDTDDNDGFRDYLQIDYGSADVRTVLREGYYATVYYHDEAYGETTGVDEYGLSAAAYAEDPAGMSTQAEDDELTDSATPGYIELGDEYGKLEYGNEVFHVADVLVGSDEEYNDEPATDDGGDTPQPTPAPDPSDNSGANDSAKPKANKQGASASTSPKTNDSIGGFGGLLFAAAAAGAAMAAYSARRVANERRESEED